MFRRPDFKGSKVRSLGARFKLFYHDVNGKKWGRGYLEERVC